jgi:16S rRNA (guanine527-N7)-methyltransferase
VRDPADALERHAADSLSGLEVEELRAARSICDVGAGAGFPGLALAVALPAAQVDLLEARARSCAVIERLAAAAGVQNARAVPVRAEQWAAAADGRTAAPAAPCGTASGLLASGASAYGAATARALAPLAVLAEYAAPLLELGGVLVAWKGARDPAEESAGARAAEAVGLAPSDVRAVRPFPGARDRHLHVYVKVAATPDRFPRRPGMARKRPLG